MIVGSICLASNQGLGYLARDFYRNGLIQEVLVQEHISKENYPSWFDKNDVDIPTSTNWPYCKSLPFEYLEKVSSFLDRIDLLIYFETPFYFQISEMARIKGVKILFFPMYEITPYPVYADAFVTCSDLDRDYYNRLYPSIKNYRMNIPVPSELSWKKRGVVKTFIHNAGNGGTYGRNGTKELIRAIELVKSPIKLIVRCQSGNYDTNDSRVEVVNENVDFKDLWKEGDVFVFPEKFNGLSLPIQEAFASGLGIMCGKRFPMVNWLPNDIMIPVDDYEIRSITNVKFKSAIYSEKNIANTIDLWYNKDISEMSLLGKKWGEENSWENLKPKYLQLFEEVISGK